MTQYSPSSSFLLRIVIVGISLLYVKGGFIPDGSHHHAVVSNVRSNGPSPGSLNDCSDSEPEDTEYWADSSFELSSDDDDGIVPDSDRVLRSHAPPAEWLNLEPKGTRVCVDKDGSFTDDYDNCDNLGSGNCVLCTPRFNHEGTVQPRAELAPRVITGNETYEFLPGESMIVRRSRIGKRAPDVLIFNCNPAHPDNLKEVCENMCFGMNCLDITNSFKREDRKQVCAKNRKKNACGATVPNRCSPKYKAPPSGPAGLSNQSPNMKLSCDEFPFASTQEATNGGRTATRCVPAVHNSRQGGKIGGFYRYLLTDGGEFKIMFDYGQGAKDSTQGPSSYRYCLAKPALKCSYDAMQMS